MLSDAMRTSIYAHLNVPVPGIPNNNYQLGLAAYDPDVPFYSQPAALYERVLNLRPAEESYLSGLPIAELIFTGTPQPSSSVSAAATVSGGSPVAIGAYEPTTADLAGAEPLFAITSGLTQAINASNTPFTAYVGPNEIGNPLVAAQASMSVMGLAPTAFNVGLTIAGLGAYVATQGILPTISRTFGGSNSATVYGLVPLLDYLQSAIAGASDFAAYAKADVVTFDPSETAKRARLYRFYQLRLAQFFFGPQGATFLTGGRRGGAIA